MSLPNYSLSWEDTFYWRGVESSNSLAVVASGGCQVFSALLTNPREVLAIDININQLYLLELKLAAISELEYLEFIEFLGLSEFQKRNSRWNTYLNLRKQLSSESKYFWDMQRPAIETGIVHCGKFERYLQKFRQWFLPLVVSKRLLSSFLTSRNPEAQEEFYKIYVEGFRYNSLFNLYYGKSYMKRKGRQTELLQHAHVNVPRVFKERMKRAWYKVPIRDNYYMRYVLFGYMDSDLPLPNWAREEHYEELKRNVSKVTLKCADITDIASSGQYDIVYLSNAFEAKTEEAAIAGFKKLATAIKSDGQLVVWNNLVERKPKENQWQRLDELSDQLWNERMSAFFGYFGIFKKLR